jgi:hypothetical protein
VIGGMSATFSNRASYVSPNEDKLFLSDLLNIYRGRGAEAVHVTLSKTGLTLSFTTGDRAIASRTYSADELSIGTDGRIGLPTDRAVGADAALIAYRSESVTLFVNNEGDLVAIRSMRGAGTVAIVVPIGAYGEHMIIFPRQR